MRNITTKQEPAQLAPLIQECIAQDVENDAWICLCGNRPWGSGFFPCDVTGKPVEPIERDWPIPYYVCPQCGRIINQGTLEVVGRCSPQVWQDWWASSDDSQTYDFEKENYKPCPICGTIIDYHFHGFHHFEKENVWVCLHHTVAEIAHALGRSLTPQELWWLTH